MLLTHCITLTRELKLGLGQLWGRQGPQGGTVQGNRGTYSWGTRSSDSPPRDGMRGLCTLRSVPLQAGSSGGSDPPGRTATMEKQAFTIVFSFFLTLKLCYLYYGLRKAKGDLSSSHYTVDPQNTGPWLSVSAQHKTTVLDYFINISCVFLGCMTWT